MSKLRIWFEESIKFAICVGVFRLFEWKAPEFDAMWADVLKQILLALIAGVITYGIFEVALGRPTVHLMWYLKEEVLAIGRPDLPIPVNGRRVIQLQFHAAGTTPMSRWVCAWTIGRPLDLVLSFRPTGLVALSKQSYAPEVDVTPSQITFHINNGLRIGVNDSVEIAIRPLASGPMMAAPLDFSARLRPASTRIPFGRLVGIDKGVDGFQVRST
ncbi:hypothetical protein HYG77_04650 [Rhodococcus sp. ZPP]|uniref:hypothetical protein n=1 Tax=Rhodococcus sp. ZPP TaxID=2749906 RepID=UPI001AD896C6|nr:hypothetical protein [Rhodococcus sp. ZPP]QTJ64955.1 hypothetical protein HYG77_04650 [Rhodococcus sp. ZPP]